MTSFSIISTDRRVFARMNGGFLFDLGYGAVLCRIAEIRRAAYGYRAFMGRTGTQGTHCKKNGQQSRAYADRILETQHT